MEKNHLRSACPELLKFNSAAFTKAKATVSKEQFKGGPFFLKDSYVLWVKQLLTATILNQSSILH